MSQFIKFSVVLLLISLGSLKQCILLESSDGILNQDNSLKIKSITQCTEYLQFINLFAQHDPQDLLNTVLQPFIECSSPNVQDISNQECCDQIKNAQFSRIEWLNILHGDDELEFLYVPSLIQGVCHPAICSAQDLEQNKEFLINIARTSGLDTVINGGLTKIELPQISGNSTSNNSTNSNSTQDFEMFEDNFIPFKVQSTKKNRNVSDHVFLFIIFVLVFTFPIGMYAIGMYNRLNNSNKVQQYENQKQQQNNYQSFLNAFDYKTHLNTFIPNNKSMRKGPLDIFNFLRVIGVCLIVLIHQFQNQQLASNYHEVAQESHRPFILLIYFSFEAVDMFLFMGGFFQAISMVAGNKLQKMSEGSLGGCLNILKSLFFRFLRVWPALLINILIFTQIYYYLGSGPIWNMQEGEIEQCDEFMFSNLLFIDNLSSKYTWKCFGHSWYLSVDFQLYAFCSIMVFIASKNKAIGKLFLWATLVCCFVNNAYFLISNEILALDVADIAKFDQFTEDTTYYEVGMNFYRKPWARAPIFIMGLLFGFSYVEKSFLFSKQFTEQILSKKYMEYSFIAIAMGIISFLVYFPIPLLENRLSYSTIVQSLYFLLLPILTMLAIIIFVSVSISIYNKEEKNENKSFGKFISSRFIAVFAKISFMMYLAHILVIRYRLFSASNLTSWTVESMFVQYLMNLVFSSILAVFLHIYIEVPVGLLISIVQKKLDAKKNQNQNTEIQKVQNEKIQKEQIEEIEIQKQQQEENKEIAIAVVEKEKQDEKVVQIQINQQTAEVEKQISKCRILRKKISLSSGKIICLVLLIFVFILVSISNEENRTICFPNCKSCVGEQYNECTECVAPFEYQVYTHTCVYPEIYEKERNENVLRKIALNKQDQKRYLSENNGELQCLNGQNPQFYFKKGSYVQKWVVVFSSEQTWSQDLENILPEILPEQKGFFNFDQYSNPDFYEFNYLVILDCFGEGQDDLKNALVEQIFIQLGEQYRLNLARNVILTSIDLQGQKIALEYGTSEVIQNIFQQQFQQYPEIQLILEGFGLQQQDLEKVQKITLSTFLLIQDGKLSDYKQICENMQNQVNNNDIQAQIQQIIMQKPENFVWNPSCFFDEYLLNQNSFNTYSLGNKKITFFLNEWTNYKKKYAESQVIVTHKPQVTLNAENCNLFEEIQVNMVCQNFQYTSPRTDFDVNFQNEEEIYNDDTWGKTQDYQLREPMGAKCANGIEPSVHFKQGVKKQRWVIYMRGSSWANEWEGETFQEQIEKRYKRAEKYTKDPTTYRAANFKRSPFEDYNRGYIVYCDPGSMRQGYRKEPVYDYINDRDVWYRGYNNTVAQFNTFLTDFDLANSKEIVLIGTSSGGPSAAIYANILQDMVHAINPYVKVKLVVDGGMFLDTEDKNDMQNDQIDNHSFRQGMFNGFYGKANEEMHPPNKECVQDQKKGEEWKCLFAQHALKYVYTDIQIMILNSGYDFSQVNKVKKEYCWGYTADEGGKKTQFWNLENCSQSSMITIEEYRKELYDVINGLKQQIPNLSAWVPSCSAHGFASYSFNKDFQVPQNSGNHLYGVFSDFLNNDTVFFGLDDVSYPNNLACANQAP